MSKGDIKLSKKHGLQPTIPLCPYCGKEKNEIALLGAAGDKLAQELGNYDGRMPQHAVLPGDTEPCEKCRKDNVVCIVYDHEGGKPQYSCLLKRDAIKRIMKEEEAEKVLKAGGLNIDMELARLLGIEEAHDAAC